jgi:hypothetical protein
MTVSSVLIADEVDQELSCEAVLVRDALANCGLETPCSKPTSAPIRNTSA